MDVQGLSLDVLGFSLTCKCIIKTMLFASLDVLVLSLNVLGLSLTCRGSV